MTDRPEKDERTAILRLANSIIHEATVAIDLILSDHPQAKQFKLSDFQNASVAIYEAISNGLDY